MEASQFPPNGGPPPVQPYTGAPSLNDQNYRRDPYPQHNINGGQQGYMYQPGPPVHGQANHGYTQQQGQYQQPLPSLQSQPPPHQQQQQQSQHQNGQPLKEEEQDDRGMIGRTPSGSGPTALVPLDKTDLGETPGADNPAKKTDPAAPKEPASHSMIELGRRYTLQVVQQPQRARMCGFGDKDRRPITPPPCIRLVIIDVATGVEVDTNDIEYGLFVLNVDLWSEDGTREVNLVRHSTPTPSISSTIPTSYQQAQAGSEPVYTNPLPRVTGATDIVRSPQYPYHAYNGPGMNQPQYNSYSNQQNTSNPYNNMHQQHMTHQQHYQPQQQQQQQQRPQYGQQPPQYGQYGQQPQQTRRPSCQDFGQRQNEPPNHHVYYHTGNSVHAVAANAGRPQDNLISPPQVQISSQYDSLYGSRMSAAPTPQGMYTRNLIGSLSASAFRLSDPNDKIGIWFVLQDLSVRTEGTFRLRFSFCNVGIPSKTPNGNPANQISIVNTGKAPILASCYSDPFTVYSAKKFPGVVESTILSKCFATQGIKIPIRKDGAPKKGRGGEDFDDE